MLNGDFSVATLGVLGISETLVQSQLLTPHFTLNRERSFESICEHLYLNYSTLSVASARKSINLCHPFNVKALQIPFKSNQQDQNKKIVFI